MWVPPSEGEDGNENTNKTIDQRVVPSKFIALEMSDEAVL